MYRCGSAGGRRMRRTRRHYRAACMHESVEALPIGFRMVHIYLEFVKAGIVTRTECLQQSEHFAKCL